LPLPILLTVLAISLVYMGAAEWVKRLFYRRQRLNRARAAP
jgi:Mg2+-importing ATPase